MRIDRATKWGNPYVIGRDGSRAEVIAKYRARLWREIRAGRIDLDELAALHDRRLACWCAPEPCHGHVLAFAARWAAQRPRCRRANDMNAPAPDILAQGALLVRDFVTPAEERRILQRIAEAPWLRDLNRRVQHYGVPVRLPQPRRARAGRRRSRCGPGTWPGGWRRTSTARCPSQCIVNEYRPGQGIGMHADHRDFGRVVASLSLADDWPMRFRPRNASPVRAPRRAGRHRSHAAAPLGAGAHRSFPRFLDARHRSVGHRYIARHTGLGHVPHACGLTPALRRNAAERSRRAGTPAIPIDPECR